MIQVLLFLHWFLQPQAVASQAAAQAKALLQSGIDAENRKDLDRAVVEFRKAAELDPSSSEVLLRLGDAYMKKHDAAEAIPHLEVAHDPGALGIAQLENDEPAKAMINLQSALENDPDNPDLLFYLSRAETAASSQATDKLLAAFPNSARAHQARGQGYYQMKMS